MPGDVPSLLWHSPYGTSLSQNYGYVARPGAPMELETCLDDSIVEWAIFILPQFLVV